MCIRVKIAPVLGALSALGAMTGEALAQNTPPNSKTAEQWTGFYSGANLGGAFGGGDMLSIIPSGAPFLEGEFYPDPPQPFDPAVRNAYRNLDVDFDPSFTGGFQAGFLTSANGVVYGIEADINLLGIDDSSSSSVTSSLSGSTYTFRSQIEMDYVATLRGRLGVPAGNWLFYGTGGLAVTTIDYSHQFSGIAPVTNGNPFPISENASVSATKAGWTIGGGFEYLLSPSWSLRTEYSYTNFGAVTSSGNKISPASGNGGAVDAECGTNTGRGDEFFGDGNAPTPRQCFTHEADVVLQSVRVGLNYRFNQNSDSLTSPPPLTFDGPVKWSGPYIGAHGGLVEHDGDWGQFRGGAAQALVNSGTDYRADGWLYGGQVGYNLQFGQMVLGVEGAYSETADVGGTDSDLAHNSFTMDVNNVWTAVARAGFVWDRVLIFAKGGYANAEVDVTGKTGDTLTVSRFAADDRLDGWVLGGGVEYLLTKNFAIGLEYAHIDLGDQTIRTSDEIGTPLTIRDVSAQLDTVTLRLNYKFPGLP